MLTFNKKRAGTELNLFAQVFSQKISYAMSNFIHIQASNMSGPEVLARTQLCDLEKW